MKQIYDFTTIPTEPPFLVKLAGEVDDSPIQFIITTGDYSGYHIKIDDIDFSDPEDDSLIHFNYDVLNKDIDEIPDKNILDYQIAHFLSLAILTLEKELQE